MRSNTFGALLVAVTILTALSLPESPAQTDPVATQTSAAGPTAIGTTKTKKQKKLKKHRFKKMKARRAKRVKRRKHAVAAAQGKLHGGVSRFHKPKKHKRTAAEEATTPGQAERSNKLNSFLQNPPAANKKLPEVGEPGTSVPMTSP